MCKVLESIARVVGSIFIALLTVLVISPSLFHFVPWLCLSPTVSQVFVNRLIAFTGMSLHAGNWRSVLLTALLIAQKVWDDRCLVNGQFSLICPMFTVSKLNMLEKRFLEFLDYDVNISSRLYAKYYFELRALSEEQSNRAFALQPLNAKEARRLEVRTHRSICVQRKLHVFVVPLA